MAGTIVVDRIESDASYASTINVAGQITFSNTVNFGAFAGTAPVAGFYLPTTNNLAFTTASTERMRIDSSGNVGIGTSSPSYKLDVRTSDGTNPVGYFYNTSTGSNSPALIARGGANNAGDARIISAQDYDGNEEFGISGTGELRLNAGFGSAGRGYVCRAWVNFNGTSTVAIRASGNVSSITDNGTGDYTVNFTTAMSDADYSTVGMVRRNNTLNNAISVMAVKSGSAPTTSAVRVMCSDATGSTNGAIDVDFVNVAIFR